MNRSPITGGGMRSRAFVVLGVLSTALVTGGWLFERGLDNGSTITGPRLFDEVMTHIERYYVDSVSTSDLYGKAIDGMLGELHDPHSVYLRADRLTRLNESTTGNYGGVGIQIDVRDGWVIVVSPLPGSHADRVAWGARNIGGHRDGAGGLAPAGVAR